MATKFVIVERVYNEYLAKKTFRGYYLTSNLVEAIKCDTREEADKHLAKQNAVSISLAKINEIDFH